MTNNALSDTDRAIRSPYPLHSTARSRYVFSGDVVTFR